MNASQAPFRWLTLAVFLGLTLPLLVQRGMFMDGLLYTTVAHNQANGFGTFWEPRFSQEGFAGLKTFHEHPPLVFGMQALWFRLLGSAPWVEGAYCLLIALLNASLLVALWRAIWPAPSRLRALQWLPVLLWIIVPQVHWCIQNNMQENTMAVFTIAAVLFTVHAAQSTMRPWMAHVLAGLCVFAASFAKGPPGLFPLGAPVLYTVLTGQGGTLRAWGGTFLATVVVVGLYALLMTWPEAHDSLLTYADGRLLHRIDQAPTVDHRWRTLQHVVMAMLGPVIATLLVRRSTRRLPETEGVASTRKALALVAIGLSGVLPLMLTMVQKSFYMVAALPLISVGLACWAAPGLLAWSDRPGQGRMAKSLIERVGQVGVLGVLICAVLLFGRSTRDADLLHDTDLIGAELPEQALVGVPEAVWSQWNLQSYLMRYHFVSLTLDGRTAWWLTQGSGPAPEGYEPVPLPTRTLRLWRLSPHGRAVGPGG